ncbi:hypothetical protein ACFLS0_01110 [Candidatus Bipolaricaulota bacterium]
MIRRCVFALLAAYLIVTLVAITSLAGAYMCWMKDGSASDCFPWDGNGDCGALCKARGYDDGFGVKGSDATCGGPDGILIEHMRPDTRDWDKDEDTTEKVRWRYVVSVNCLDRDTECVEIYELYQCLSPGGKQCYFDTAVRPAKWWEISYPKTGEECECTEQVNYPGCSWVNFHFNWFCRCRPGFPYYSNSDPGDKKPPAGSWKPSDPHGVPFPLDATRSVWLGRTNIHLPEHVKYWTITLVGKSADMYGIVSAKGFVDSAGAGAPVTSSPGRVTSIVDSAGVPKTRTFTIALFPQPDWEVAEFKRDPGGGIGKSEAWLTVRMATMCSRVSYMDRSFRMEDSFFGVPREFADSLSKGPRITSVFIFPRSAPIDPDAPLWFSSDTGDWPFEYVYETPSGEFSEFGGVLWRTDGLGLTPDDTFNLAFSLEGGVRGDYDLYAFDANAGGFQYFLISADGQLSQHMEREGDSTALSPTNGPDEAPAQRCGDQSSTLSVGEVPFTSVSQAVAEWANALWFYHNLLRATEQLTSRLLAGDAMGVMLEQISLYLDSAVRSAVPAFLPHVDLLRDAVQQASEQDLRRLATVFASAYLQAGGD